MFEEIPKKLVIKDIQESDKIVHISMSLNHIGILVKNGIIDHIDENMDISKNLRDFIIYLKDFIGQSNKFWKFFKGYELIN